MKKPLVAFIATIVLAVATQGVAFAQFGITTPPVFQFDTVQVPVFVNPGTVDNWAGVFMRIHVLDPDDVAVTHVVSPLPVAVDPPFSVSYPLGPSATSSPMLFTAWLSETVAVNSGTTLGTGPHGAFTVTVEAPFSHNTPAHRDDLDLVVQVGPIFHADNTGVAGASTFVWRAFNDGSPIAGTTSFNTSDFYGFFTETFNIGLENVPEPASIFMVGGGLACLLFGAYTRRRRQRAMAAE